MNEKSKGGARPGAGRKPLPKPKRPRTLYIDDETTEKWGGWNELKKKLYDFISIQQFAQPQVIKTLGGEIVVPNASPEEIGKPATVTFSNPDKISVEPTDRGAIQRQIEAIRAEKCPKERDTLLGRKAWTIEQQNRIKELQSKL